MPRSCTRITRSLVPAQDEQYAENEHRNSHGDTAARVRAGDGSKDEDVHAPHRNPPQKEDGPSDQLILPYHEIAYEEQQEQQLDKDLLEVKGLERYGSTDG